MPQSAVEFIAAQEHSDSEKTEILDIASEVIACERKRQEDRQERLSGRQTDRITDNRALCGAGVSPATTPDIGARAAVSDCDMAPSPICGDGP